MNKPCSKKQFIVSDVKVAFIYTLGTFTVLLIELIGLRNIGITIPTIVLSIFGFFFLRIFRTRKCKKGIQLKHTYVKKGDFLPDYAECSKCGLQYRTGKSNIDYNG